MDAYINGIGKYLPGDPVASDEVDDYLGEISFKNEKLVDSVVKKSGVSTRHFALDKKQRVTCTNTDMAVAAIKAALKTAHISPNEVEFLAVGTVSGDLIAPGIANMAQADLIDRRCETLSINGFCSSGVQALKASYLNVKSGDTNVAVACASEMPSRIMRSSHFEQVDEWRERGQADYRAEFLRYMISDGASAVVVQPDPSHDNLSLHIDWISISSYAHEFETCMSLGAANIEEGMRSWQEYETIAEACRSGAMLIKQNIEQLPSLVSKSLDEYERLIKKGLFNPEHIDHLVMHYSSDLFLDMIFSEADRRNLSMVPRDKWSGTLDNLGAVGSATIFLSLEELCNNNNLSNGDKVLCTVPESGRCTIAFFQLTVV